MQVKACSKQDRQPASDLLVCTVSFFSLQVPGNSSAGKPNGMSGKNAKRMRKAMQQLEEEEAAPKKAKIFSPAEIAEGVK